MSRGRKPSEERILVMNKIKKLTAQNPYYRKQLIEKVERYLIEVGHSGDTHKKAVDMINKIVKKLAEDGLLVRKKVGKEAIYCHPALSEKVDEMLAEPEEEIDMPDEFMPIIKKWIEELPEVAENDFGVFEKEKQVVKVDSEIHEFIVENMERAVSWEYEERIPISYTGGYPQLEIEFNRYFNKMLEKSKRLMIMWENIKRKSVELWDGILELNEEIKDLIENVFGIPLSMKELFLVDTVSELMIWLLRIFAYSYASKFDFYMDYMGQLPDIMGFKLKGKEFIFYTSSGYLWNGKFFERASSEQLIYLLREKNEKTKVRTTWYINKPPRWNLADAYIFGVNGRGYICLSKDWIRERLGSTDIVSAFDEFCVSRFNTLIEKVGQGEIAKKAKKMYDLQTEIQIELKELREILEGIIAKH